MCTSLTRARTLSDARMVVVGTTRQSRALRRVPVLNMSGTPTPSRFYSPSLPAASTRFHESERGYQELCRGQILSRKIYHRNAAATARSRRRSPSSPCLLTCMPGSTTKESKRGSSIKRFALMLLGAKKTLPPLSSPLSFWWRDEQTQPWQLWNLFWLQRRKLGNFVL